MFKKFNHIPGYTYDSGWDKYALDYQKLLVKDTVYYLTKELIHTIIDLIVPNQKKTNFTVLDINCGTGNDFSFFFKRGWNVVGCDGSLGMLNKASEDYNPQIQSGQLALYSGLIESIKSSDFEGRKFDLIFSVTGGFSYVDDMQLSAINKQLSQMLKQDGKIVLAHLNRFCLPESLYRMAYLKHPNLRKSRAIKVSIKKEEFTMHLRGPKKLKALYSSDFKNLKLYPLLSISPPYQTGFNPGRKNLARLKRIELKSLQLPLSAYWADQVVMVGESKGKSNQS